MPPDKIKWINRITWMSGLTSTLIWAYRWWNTGAFWPQPTLFQTLFNVIFGIGFLYLWCWNKDAKGTWFWVVTGWLSLGIINGLTTLLNVVF